MIFPVRCGANVNSVTDIRVRPLRMKVIDLQTIHPGLAYIRFAKTEECGNLGNERFSTSYFELLFVYYIYTLSSKFLLKERNVVTEVKAPLF